jgi:hypothetical protein
MLSCGKVITVYVDVVDFAIISPRANWTYYNDTIIMLAVNVKTDGILWESDISGALGEGNHLALFLPEGLHRISADIMGVKRELIVPVFPRAQNSRSILVHFSPLEIKARRGMYFSYSHTHDGTVNDFTILSVQNAASQDDVFSLKTHLPQSSNWSRGDIRLPIPLEAAPVDTVNRARLFTDSYAIGEKRTFFVVNTRNQLGVPHNLEAILTHQSDRLSVWVQASYAIYDDLIRECIKTIETLVIPRVETLWGRAADIDGDGRIAILFSHTLNEERVATGFFNPADFFARNNNALSGGYNPASNEMDIIYIAMPEPYPDSPFSPESIIATIVHELTHVSTFTVKTWNRLKNGEDDAAREELFLDEGWSHLSESLVGLGTSGGNIRLLRRFLNNTSMYSFAGVNRLGQHDSIGMRGAITLFLSWLFWEAGGMTWNIENPVELIDLGGITFLQRMVSLRETGWESIGQAFGQPTNILFNEMLSAINRYRISNLNHIYKIDPLTNEAVDFFVNMGYFYYAGGTSSLNIGFPVPSSIFDQNTLLPWSVVFYDTFYLPGITPIILNSTRNNGDVFFSYTVIQ